MYFHLCVHTYTWECVCTHVCVCQSKETKVDAASWLYSPIHSSHMYVGVATCNAILTHGKGLRDDTIRTSAHEHGRRIKNQCWQRLSTQSHARQQRSGLALFELPALTPGAMPRTTLLSDIRRLRSRRTSLLAARRRKSQQRIASTKFLLGRHDSNCFPKGTHMKYASQRPMHASERLGAMGLQRGCQSWLAPMGPAVGQKTLGRHGDSAHTGSATVMSS